MLLGMAFGEMMPEVVLPDRWMLANGEWWA